jgi:2-oxoglutarate dehydrogenase E2 component (dihydrolipoamide succinyltransferase)
MGFSEIEKAIAEFARKANDNTLKPEELEGGTFTITNGGVFGSLVSTPIINPPQSAILGLHAIQIAPSQEKDRWDSPDDVRGAHLRSPDHRRQEAVLFLHRVKDAIETLRGC